MTSANGLPKIGRGEGNWEEFLGFHQFPTRGVNHRRPKLTTRSIYYLVREFNGEKSLKLN